MLTQLVEDREMGKEVLTQLVEMLMEELYENENEKKAFKELLALVEEEKQEEEA